MQAKDMFVIMYMPFQKEAAAALPFWGPAGDPGDIEGPRGFATDNPALDRWRKKSKEAMLKSKAAAGMDHNYLLKTQFKKVSLFKILNNLNNVFATIICLVLLFFKTMITLSVANIQNPFPLHLVKLRNRALKFLVLISLVCLAKYPKAHEK